MLAPSVLYEKAEPTRSDSERVRRLSPRMAARMQAALGFATAIERRS